MVVVSQQFNATSQEITAPKNGRVREAILTPPAREALLALPPESEWAFTTIRGAHYTPSSRAYPLEGGQGGGRIHGEPVPRDSALRGLVHGQRAGARV
jgi:hypothetical protein